MPKPINQGFLRIPKVFSLLESNKKKILGRQRDNSPRKLEDALSFKEFVQSVYSIYGTYIRMMNHESIESHLRQVFNMLRVIIPLQ